MMDVNFLETAPKYRQVQEKLLEDIVTGQLPDGTFLPSECELAEAYGVGRSTLRAALKVVRDRGFLETSQGRRSVVRRRPAGGLRRLVCWARTVRRSWNR